MMSRPPKPSMAVLTNFSAKPSAVTLPAQARACPPAALMAATVSSAGPASRSFTTTLAPSLASFIAMARPMPRPEPETMATLPSSFFMGNSSDSGWGWMRRIGTESVQRDDGVAAERDLLAIARSRQLDARAGAAAVVELLDDLADALHAIGHLGDGREAHAVVEHAALRHPVGERARQVGHRQHAVREHVLHAGLAGEVEVDVDGVVVTRGAGK